MTDTDTDTDTDTSAPAWAWVLQHAKLIERVARRFVAGTSLAREDFRGELIADLAAVFPKYDPSRSAPVTWIWMRASKVRRGMVRAAVRGTGSPILDDVDPCPVGSRGHEARTEARAEVISIYSRMSPAQRLAAFSVLRGWDRVEVRQRLGMSLRERDALVASAGGAR